jgi:ABC-type nitrate/sulfonate/bicarbonate transport system ATPase subunit
MVVQAQIGSLTERIACRRCSCGTAQRNGIARLPVHRPWLLLLDEPTAALGALTGVDLQELDGNRSKDRPALFLPPTGSC